MSSSKEQQKAEAIDQAVDAVITAREFCGNERAAMNEAFEDAGYRASIEDIQQVMSEANKHWSGWQRGAPISFEERQQIERDMA